MIESTKLHIRRNNMKIVILDNSTTVCLKIEELLEEMAQESDDLDLDINIYENAAEALEFIKENEMDLVFSSIETEPIDGVSFVESLLVSNPQYKSKLFIVTSQSRTDHFEEIKDVGAKRFIRKPINEDYFKHHIIPEVNKVILRG